MFGIIFWSLFIWKADFQGKKRQIFQSLVHTPNGHNDGGWAITKPGTQNSIWIPYLRACTPALGPSSTAFPGRLAGNWIRSGHELARGQCQYVVSLTHSSTNAGAKAC